MNTLVNTNKNTNLMLVIAASWFLFLFFDSIYFNEHYFDGKLITTVIVIFMTTCLIWSAPLKLRVMAIAMIPLSWLGEYIFCDLLDMYDYRNGSIPIYVPFGHSSI